MKPEQLKAAIAKLNTARVALEASIEAVNQVTNHHANDIPWEQFKKLTDALDPMVKAQSSARTAVIPLQEELDTEWPGV
jgi:hypothetical protein